MVQKPVIGHSNAFEFTAVLLSPEDTNDAVIRQV